MATPPPDKLLIIGLGNPGPEYEGTRHNAGAMVVSRLAARLKLRLTRDRATGCFTARRGGLTLGIPGSYMNESGGPVARLTSKAGVAAPLLVSDDLDLPVGTLRLRMKGTAGGHNGLASVISALGTDQFPRLKVGIGRPESREKVVDYVLSPFGAEEQRLFTEALDRAAKALHVLITEGMDKAIAGLGRE